VLGLVKYSDTYSFVVADIPGLIEGASEGKGLGFDFLRHIERTRLYIHVVDATQGDAYDNYVMINNELKAYNKKLIKRPQVVVVNKSELLSEDEKKSILAKFKKKKIAIDFISAKEGEGVAKLLNRVYNELKDLPPAEEEKTELKVYREPDTLTVEKLDDNVYSLHGKRVEKFVSMLDFSTNETVQVFRRYLERQGLNKFLREKGVKTGDFVIIGDKDFIFEED
jgi:GTP-binding protein